VKKKDISVAVINHGCKLNQFEGEALENAFKKAGFRVVYKKDWTRTDVTIVNTCTVTNKSDRKSRNTINKAIRAKNAGGLVVVTGCYAETNGEEFKKKDGVDLVIGNRRKAALPSIIRSYLDSRAFDGLTKDLTFSYDGPQKPNRSRVFVKVQDGCDMICSYCKVPLARGKSRSRNYEDIIEYVKAVVGNGYKEIVLTGVNLGDYTYNDVDLSGLITLLLKCEESFRIRLSSIEPFKIKGDLNDIIRCKRVVPHFHLPLQSGSDRILKLMNRPYTTKSYLDMVDRIRNERPESHLATDIIVGYPTESDKDFLKTIEVMQEVGFASAHIFKYSVRPGTKAAGLKDDVPYSEKVIRSNKAENLKVELNYCYRKGFLGETRETVFEKRDGSWTGITDNYIRVNISAPKGQLSLNKDLSKNMLPVKITEVFRDITSGVIAGDEKD
jgi:threonylcarbamoyladenosine tRNA methylthiotransferase MtaB